ncbi:hypothetical protein [Sulfobacillus thermosulfidooxidans]|uniref:hypothetical protein n=1 Tax=Sulfobacillus thermosulfidooxidans TaxID=28034 RepID=UPI0011129A9C|nr:hypothetical protein [Sulfobacillus thermosulfidooxidans]
MGRVGYPPNQRMDLIVDDGAPSRHHPIRLAHTVEDVLALYDLWGRCRWPLSFRGLRKRNVGTAGGAGDVGISCGVWARRGRGRCQVPSGVRIADRMRERTMGRSVRVTGKTGTPRSCTAGIGRSACTQDSIHWVIVSGAKTGT